MVSADYLKTWMTASESVTPAGDCLLRSLAIGNAAGDVGTHDEVAAALLGGEGSNGKGVLCQAKPVLL